MNDETKQVTALPSVNFGLLAARTPDALIDGATKIADKLANVIHSRQLAKQISGRKYVQVEGWQTLAALLGCVAHEDSVEEFDDGARYVAKVSFVRMADGATVSTASGECGSDEEKWSESPRFQRRSMAVTRATGKAARLAFSWIMALAGYETTPAEEMVDETERKSKSRGRKPKPTAKPGKIDEKQLGVLKREIEKHGADEAALLAKFKVEKLDELEFAQLNDALDFARAKQ